MANCNNTIDFIKEKERMCNSYNDDCKGCPLDNEDVFCSQILINNTEKAVKLVQKWSDENPVRTILMDFFDKYPNAKGKDDIIPNICIRSLGYKVEVCCGRSCVDCWNTPLSETK